MPSHLMPFGKDHSALQTSDGRRPVSGSSKHITGSSLRPEPDRRDSTNAQRIQLTMDSLKRHSIAAITSKHSKDKADKIHREKSEKSGLSRPNSPGVQKASTKMDILVESPPNMLYGAMQNSTGALYSGQLRITVIDPEIVLESLSMVLAVSVTSKKPVAHGCPNCITQNTELHKWSFIKDSKHLKQGQHNFPFSYLLPGHLAASTRGNLGILEYYLNANANISLSTTCAITSASGSGSQSGTPKATTPTSSTTALHATAQAPQIITLRHPLLLLRAIAPVPEKNSLRIFPPTNITATLTFVPVTHPIGDLTVLMKVSGLVEKKEKQDVQAKWCLRKFMWKLEEKERMVSPACSKHTHKVGGEGKGIQHEETRVIGQDEIKQGWKTDSNGANIETEFKCRPRGSVRPLCDVESPNGLTVAHAMVVELVITEEWAPLKKPTHSTPTGAARVLRMQFPIIMTERAGLGIAWDEEQPPVYEDVPASPPLYPVNSGPDLSSWAQGGLGVPDDARSQIIDYTGPPLDEPPPPIPTVRAIETQNTTANGDADGYGISGWEDMQRITTHDHEVGNNNNSRWLDSSDFEVDRQGARRPDDYSSETEDVYHSTSNVDNLETRDDAQHGTTTTTSLTNSELHVSR